MVVLLGSFLVPSEFSMVDWSLYSLYGMILVTLLLFLIAFVSHFKPVSIWVDSSSIHFFDFNFAQKLVWKNLLLKIWPFTQSLCWKFAKVFSNKNPVKVILLGWKILQCLEQDGYIVWGHWNISQSNRGRSYCLWFNRMPTYIESWLWAIEFFCRFRSVKNGSSVSIECSHNLLNDNNCIIFRGLYTQTLSVSTNP